MYIWWCIIYIYMWWYVLYRYICDDVLYMCVFIYVMCDLFMIMYDIYDDNIYEYEIVVYIVMYDKMKMCVYKWIRSCQIKIKIMCI